MARTIPREKQSIQRSFVEFIPRPAASVAMAERDSAIVPPQTVPSNWNLSILSVAGLKNV